MSPVDRARAYVAKIPPAISGEGGHNRTFHVACVLVHGFALEIDEAMQVFDEYNVFCNPPWKDSQLRHKLQDALKTPHNRPRGYLLSKTWSTYVPGIVRPSQERSSVGGLDLLEGQDYIPLDNLIVMDVPAQPGDGLSEEEYDEETGYPIIDGAIIPF